MLSHGCLTTARVLAVFADEVSLRRGHVTDTFNDGKRLFARAVLPHVSEVQPGDQLRGGVAIKANQEGVWLYPYLFRLVCSNGAIFAQTVEERPIADPYLRVPDAVLETIRKTMQACCDEKAFSTAVATMQEARTATATDLILQLLPWLTRLSTGRDTNLFPPFMDHFLREGDSSRFGMANAVTATARDVQDPDVKWDLEKLGGAVARGTVPRLPTKDGGATALLVDEQLVQTA